MATSCACSRKSRRAEDEAADPRTRRRRGNARGPLQPVPADSVVGSDEIAGGASAGDWRGSAGQRNPEKSGAAGIRTDRDRRYGQDRGVESFAQHFVSQQRCWLIQGGGGSEKRFSTCTQCEAEAAGGKCSAGL